MAAMELTKKLDVIESHLSRADTKTFGLAYHFSRTNELFKDGQISVEQMQKRLTNAAGHIEETISRLQRVKIAINSVKEQLQ